MDSTPHTQVGWIAMALGRRGAAGRALTQPQRVGADLNEAVNAVLALPESRELFAGTSEETQAAAHTALREAFTPYAGPSGVVTDGTAWLVNARH